MKQLLLWVTIMLLLVACDIEPRPMGSAVRTQVVGADMREAPQLFLSYGCTSCHFIPGVVALHGNTGPDLSNWAERRMIAGTLANNPPNLISWIQHPQAIRPGSAMPDLGVSEQEARDMAAWLYQLR